MQSSHAHRKTRKSAAGMATKDRKRTTKTKKQKKPQDDGNRLEQDPQHREQGGWKIHLTIGPKSYEQRITLVKNWLKKNFKALGRVEVCSGGGESHGSWKHLCGGDQHEKDFTIYLGSYATMLKFVRRIEGDPIVEQLDPCKAGTDRIVGDSGKLGARFDPKQDEGRFRGLSGMPFTLEEARLVASGKTPLERSTNRTEAIKRSKARLREKFADYFLPEAIE